MADSLTTHSSNADNESEEDRVYIDSRGTEMEELSTFSEALREVVSLAMDARRPPARLREAIEMAEDFLKNDNFINSKPELAFPNAAKTWPEIDTSGSPKTVTEAIAICLKFARQEARDPATADGIDDAVEIDIEQMNLDIVEDLLGMHGPALDAMMPAAVASPKARKSRAKAPSA